MDNVRPLRGPHAVLGVSQKAAPSEVENAWLKHVAWFRPGRELESDHSALDYQQAMNAFRDIVGDEGISTEEALAITSDGRSLLDWAPWYVRSQQESARKLRYSNLARINLSTVMALSGMLEELPDYIPGKRLAPLVGLNIRPILEDLLGLDEFADDRELPLNPDLFEIRWRRTKWMSQSRIVKGSCRPIPKAERELWEGDGDLPLWRITLSLPYWLLMDEYERRELIHHELGHAQAKVLESEQEGAPVEIVPNGEGHDYETFYPTKARYGAGSPFEARLLFEAVTHPRTKAYLAQQRLNIETGEGRLYPVEPWVGQVVFTATPEERVKQALDRMEAKGVLGAEDRKAIEANLDGIANAAERADVAERLASSSEEPQQQELPLNGKPQQKPEPFDPIAALEEQVTAQLEQYLEILSAVAPSLTELRTSQLEAVMDRAAKAGIGESFRTWLLGQADDLKPRTRAVLEAWFSTPS